LICYCFIKMLSSSNQCNQSIIIVLKITFKVALLWNPDVLVLLVHYFPKMKNTSELWFQTGLITSTKDYRRYIPIHELCKSISFRLRSTELYMSEHSIREKSLNWLGVSYRAFNINFFPIPKNEEVVSHPVKAMLDCSCLASTQEEADTRIILHALYSDKLY
jgi:hypothetical protein